MKNDFTSGKNQLKHIVDQHFAPVLDEIFGKQIDFIESVKSLQKKHANIRFDQSQNSACVKSLKKYKEDLILLVEHYFTIKEPASFDTQFPAFTEALTTYINSFDERIVRIQDQERFTGQPGDSLLVKLMKRFKRFAFAVTKIPERVVNLFRKLRKKDLKPLKGWNQQINYKNLARYYLKNQLSALLMHLLPSVHQKKCAASFMAWKADEEIETRAEAFLTSGEPFIIDESVLEICDQAIETLVEEKAAINREIAKRLGQIQTGFESAFFKAGTFELPNRRFRLTRILNKEKKIQEKTITLEKGWMGTWQILRDDWQIDNELYHLLQSAYGASFDSRLVLTQKLDSHIIPKLNEIRKYLVRSKKRIEQAKEIADQRKVITRENEDIFSTFITSMIPAITDQVVAQDFPSLFDQVETITEQYIRKISTKRSILKNPDFTTPVRSSSISFISPYELIMFESWPQLYKVIKQVKIGLVGRLDIICRSLLEIGQIASFSLESALEFNAEESSASSPGKIASEGIDRSLQRLDEIKQSLTDLDNLWDKELTQGLQVFSESLIKFTNNNNIIDLRIRIAKGKALKQGRLIGMRLIHKARNFYPGVTITAIRLNRQATHFVKGTFKKYGIASTSECITAEMADFLVETKKSNQQLPFVYQRLFKIESLSDTNFFIGRTRELQSLQNAFDHWLLGRFAATIIVGEKGSGVTSLVDIFLKRYSCSYPVFRLQANSCITSKNELYHFLNDQFKQTMSTVEAWAGYFNEQGKQVVIIEDIQRFYIKKVNGFDALKELTELFSLTSQTVLWVMTCTEYAFNYLDKTILLSEQFRYLIRLELFDDETMVDIIKRRHVVSGYNVRYEPAPSNLASKKFRRLTDEERQSILQREYFGHLNKNVKSNIGLGLIYWLRSVSEVSGSTIFIKSLKDMNLSFLNSLSTEKLFVLCAFILHERLTEETLGMVMNLKRIEARRLIQPLSEDGILISRNGFFSINPLIYIKTISLLKNKNIIH